MRFDVITLKLDDSQISTTVFEVRGTPRIQTFWLIGWENPEKKLLNLLLFIRQLLYHDDDEESDVYL